MEILYGVGRTDESGEGILLPDRYTGSLECRVQYFGREKMIPVYIEVEDGTRLIRAVERERTQEHPGYEELCRRFLADAKDFSEEKLNEAGITRRFVNQDLNETEEEIRRVILENR